MFHIFHKERNKFPEDYLFQAKKRNTQKDNGKHSHEDSVKREVHCFIHYTIIIIIVMTVSEWMDVEVSS